MLLSILTPYILFSAFNLPLGFQEATLLHLSLIIGQIPASTPGNVGIFEGVVVFMLNQFGPHRQRSYTKLCNCLPPCCGHAADCFGQCICNKEIRGLLG